MERCLKVLSGTLNIAAETCAKLLCRFEALSNSQWKTIGRATGGGDGRSISIAGARRSGSRQTTRRRSTSIPCEDF